MALRQRYDAGSEIPDVLREHYVEKDGAWVLQTDPAMEDVTGLKNALTQERNLRREAEKGYSELKIKFEGVDPDEVVKLRERVKGLDDADVYDKQGIEALVLRRTESMKADHERQLTQKTRELEALKTEREDLKRRWEQDRIRTALLQAGASAGVYDRAMDDFVQRGLGVFNALDEEGLPVSRKADGEIRYGKDGISPLRPEEWGVALKPTAPHLWPPSAGGGAPAHHGGNGQGIDYTKITNPAERLTAWRAAQGIQHP
jgi:hypothetical protein